MNEQNIETFLSSDELRLKIMNEGRTDRVEVNQRMLIDKMLARYSSEFVVYRELIQNSDDAQSTSFTLEITCDPSTAKINYESINKDHLSINQRKKSKILAGIGQRLKNHQKTNTINSNKDLNNNLFNNQYSFENNFNNCIITEIRTINNGNIFSEDDWKRIITIAEGNTNVDAIGQFGVGFFSVFSYSEQPMIVSGKNCLVFSWQNGKTLVTFRKELSDDQQQSSTSIILKMKNKYILKTKSTLEINETYNSLQTSTKSNKNTLTNETVSTMDLIQLKFFFTKILSFTKYINELIIKINGLIVFQVNKTKQNLSTKLSIAANKFILNKTYNFLRFNSLTQTEQKFSIHNGPSITFNHIDIQAELIIDKNFHKQIQNVLKKKLIPLKFHNQEIFPSGQIFIGSATHQTTGIGMHLFTHFIPTIERENIDLQDPYISIWNEQLLVSIGKIIRFIYDQTILDIENNIQQEINQQLNLILTSYAFQTSAPNKDISDFLLDGFFSSNEDILVPVKQSPSHTYLSLISSTQAFLTNSKHIEAFLPIPLVPFTIGKHNFFKVLKEHQWIEEIDNETILFKIHQSIFLLNEFIELLHWLCKYDIDNNDKSYIERVLSKIHYRETHQSCIIKLENITFYHTLNICSLPLPSNVLPSNIVGHISRENLQTRLSLSAISPKNLVEYYFNENQQQLFHNENTSKILLSFICQYWNQFNDIEINKIKNSLSHMKCIPTSQGMKSPNESYIRSLNLSPDLPIITLYIPSLEKSNNQEEKQESIDYSVSIDFLRSIGCRTIYISTLTNTCHIESNISTNNSQILEHFIQDLSKQRKHMSDNDFHALKHNQSITGTTLKSNNEMKHKYKPSDLHFPSVAIRLQWNELPIIDWIDIDPHSQEYSFLRELGVREVPDLYQLLNRIDQEHQYGSKKISNYQLPKSLIFFAENFQEHYSKVWKKSDIEKFFLPSSTYYVNHSTKVILRTPEIIFQEPNPIFPCLLPDVLRYFSQYFNISLLGVEKNPSLPIAFNILMKKRNQLLTYQTAAIYFAYFNTLDGLNTTFIQNISNISFIPLSENNIYCKPSQVFIRSKSSTTDKISQDNNNNNNVFDDEIARGLIDYIDYSDEANSFLLNIGVRHFPSAENLADLLIDRQEIYFKRNEDTSDQVLSAKVRFYTNCLMQLSIVSNTTQQLYVEPLHSRLINKPWCLAYQIPEGSNGIKYQEFKITKPSDIYLDDDNQYAIKLRPLCAPEEKQLIQLYKKFGAKWISDCVERTLINLGKKIITDRSKELHNRILHRLDMLFVNNRGEYLEQTDLKRLELLRKQLSVYETEDIQWQLKLQNKTITLNPIEYSSCALEHKETKVYLYIHKDISTLDYIDIATELMRFVCKKSVDTLVHSISDKLTSPLETLKRRGIPVDRLLKSPEQQPVKLLLQAEKTKSNIAHTVEINRIDHFGRYKSEDDAAINTMIRASRSYSQQEFYQQEHFINENNTSCECVPAANMIRYDKLLHEIPLYIDQNLKLTSFLIQQATHLAWLLSGLAKQVFNLPVETMHLFRDIDSARIAFNSNGALFFNLRYFEQVFFGDLKSYMKNSKLSSSSTPIVRTIINFYFMITCHELSHNIDLNHDLNVIKRFEK
ncbi:unnamed protein product, partial [Rotaria sp. Silwood1]